MPAHRTACALALCLTVTALGPAGTAAAPAQATAAAADTQAYYEGLIQNWATNVVHLPPQPPLDADLAQRLPALADELRPLLLAAGLRWLAELRAAAPGADENEIHLRLMARLNDELVGWLVASPGAERESTEWTLAQHPAFCRERPSLHGQRWSLLAERLLWLQPLLGAARDAAIAAERQRWQAWLAGRLPAASTPTPPPQLQALQAAERQRGDEPVSTVPMVPWLSSQVLGTKPPRPYANLAQTCALMQWWLANEVQRGALTPPQAMQQFRFGILPVSEDLLFMPSAVRQRARDASPDEYPPIAQRFEVTGSHQAELVLDATGRVLEVVITARRLTRPGLPPGRSTVAFEQEMDRVTFARLRAMRMNPPAPAELAKGVARKTVEMAWKLD